MGDTSHKVSPEDLCTVRLRDLAALIHNCTAHCADLECAGCPLEHCDNCSSLDCIIEELRHILK